MRGSAVIEPVRNLKAVKSAVGDDVRHLEIFNYGSSGPTFVAFNPRTFDAIENPFGDIEVSIFRPTTDIQVGDVIQYDLDQSGNWVDSGITWTDGPYPIRFFIIGQFLPGPLDVRIRYTRGNEFSFPSIARTVLITGGGPEG